MTKQQIGSVVSKKKSAGKLRLGSSVVERQVRSDAIDVKRAAAFLGVSVVTVRRLVGERAIPHCRVNKRILFIPEELDEYRLSRRIPVIRQRSHNPRNDQK